MKKFVSLAVCTVLVLVGLMLIAHFSPQVSGSPASSASENQIHFTSNAPSSQESGNLPAMTSQQDSSLVRTYDGKIGIFKNEEKSPFEIIDVDVSSLPQTDQLLLATGIEADSTAELQRIREDYES